MVTSSIPESAQIPRTVRLKLTKSVVDRVSYQSEQLKLLKKLQRSGELGLEQFKETKERLLTPYKGKDGRPKWRRCVVWDTELSGFGLRITPENVKTFVLSYRSGGRKRLMKVGRFGVLTVDEARKKTRRELAAVGDGADPLKVRQERRRADAEAKTVAELSDAFMERHSKLHKKSWKEDQRRIETRIKPALGHLRLDDVTRERVGQFYREIGSVHPYEANRLLALLSVMFNLAEEWGFQPEGTPNPAKMKKPLRFREKRRERHATTEEIPRLLAAIDSEKNLYIQALFQLLLLTGLRKSEWLHRRWRDLDLGRANIRLEDTKAGEPRHVPLSSAALEILRGLPRMVGNSHIFPSSVRPGRPLVDIRRSWDRIRKEAGCMDLTLHGWRHTTATLIADAGYPAHAIQMALGHSSIEQSMDYVHASDSLPREALEAVAKKVRRARAEHIDAEDGKS